jgi:hypothetical protein
MLKKFFTNQYMIAGILVFLLLLGIGLFAIDLTLGESLLLAMVVTVMGVGAAWWQGLF